MFARGVNAAQIVVGVSRRRRWKAMLAVGVSERIVAGSGDIDVHLVTHEYAGRGQVLFAVERDLHAGALDAWRLPALPPGHPSRTPDVRAVRLPGARRAGT